MQSAKELPGDLKDPLAQPADRVIPLAVAAILDEREAAYLLQIELDELRLLRRDGTGPMWLRLAGGGAAYTRLYLARYIDTVAASNATTPPPRRPPAPKPREPITVIGRRRKIAAE